MEVSVTLDHGCIQAAIKRRHERLVKAYLKTPPRGREKIFMEEQIEGLTYLLENGDFAHMRSKFSVLTGEEKLEVLLLIPKAFKDTRLLADGKIILMKWKNNHAHTNK